MNAVKKSLNKDEIKKNFIEVQINALRDKIKTI